MAFQAALVEMPAVQTLNPKQQALNPKPQTLDPKPKGPEVSAAPQDQEESA